MFRDELRAFSESLDRYLPAGAEGASLAGQYLVARKKVWSTRIPQIGLLIAWALLYTEWQISTDYYIRYNYLNASFLLLIPFLIMNAMRPYIERRYWLIENQIMLKKMETFAKAMRAFGIDESADNSPESTKTAEECAAFFDLTQSIEPKLPVHVKWHIIFCFALIAPLSVFFVRLFLSVEPLFPILWAILFISTFIAVITELAIAVSLGKLYVKALIVQGDLPLSLVDSMKYAVEHDAILILQLYQRWGVDALRKGWIRPTRKQRRELRYNDMAQ